ncbi:EnvZ/OmpR regulon moderator MzrA [Pantoea sp. BAV 3049]|uniref:EnvZ/OmpR regulon moderator MzrA n=1 Tax=Pantoea sp. BAV 3049 TaxID=2654188 RepID=UPI00131C1622
MLNQIKPWATPRCLTIVAVATAALLMVVFLPALFRSETALQIRASRQGIALPDGFYVYQRLNAEGIQIKSITPDKNSLVIKFDSQEQSVAAEKVLRELLPYGFDIAQLEQPAASEWISRISPHRQTVG